MRAGIRDLFPSRKSKSAMWGVIALGSLITYMELAAAMIFSRLIINTEVDSSTRSTLMIAGFLLVFASIRVVSYFQSVYRLTVFEKAFRQTGGGSRAVEAWRWPMAIAMVGIIGQIARMTVVTTTVIITAWVYGLLLVACSVSAVLIVNRIGQRQYLTHLEFAAAKKNGNPPSAAERIGTRIRAGERAGLLAVGPVMVYVAVLGAGAAVGEIEAHSALVLFIAGRSASNIYGSLSNASMRFIRAQVNVEEFGNAHGETRLGVAKPVQTRPDDELLERLLSGPYAWDPPAQAFARLIDDGYVIGNLDVIGRVMRNAGFGPTGGVREQLRPAATETKRAVAPNQIWVHGCFVLPLPMSHQSSKMQVILDVYSRVIICWNLVEDVNERSINELYERACMEQNVGVGDVEMHSRAKIWGAPESLHDFLAMLRVGRTLLWRPTKEVSLLKTPLERPGFPTAFEDKVAASSWMSEFTKWYNYVFYQPDVGYLHPADVHTGLADAIAAKRQRTLNDAVENGTNVEAPEGWRIPGEAWVATLSFETIRQDPPTTWEKAFDEDEDT